MFKSKEGGGGLLPCKHYLWVVLSIPHATLSYLNDRSISQCLQTDLFSSSVHSRYSISLYLTVIVSEKVQSNPEGAPK